MLNMKNLFLPVFFAGHIAREQSDHHINFCGHFVFCLSNTERFATFTYHSIERWYKPEQRYVWIINFPKASAFSTKNLRQIINFVVTVTEFSYIFRFFLRHWCCRHWHGLAFVFIIIFVFVFFAVLNNIFNLLITVNAASNFILYCLLSDKYRKTVKALLCGVKTMRRNTMSSSRFTSGRTTTSFYSNSRSRTSNIFKMPIYKQREPRFSISSKEYANLQTETAKRNRFSITTLTSSSRHNSIVSVIKISSLLLLSDSEFNPTVYITNRTQFRGCDEFLMG